MSNVASRTPNWGSIRSRQQAENSTTTIATAAMSHIRRAAEGPSMKGVFQRPYLSLSGLPANDERMTDIVKFGRAKMEGFNQTMSDQQIKDLLAYLHTL